MKTKMFWDLTIDDVPDKCEKDPEGLHNWVERKKPANYSRSGLHRKKCSKCFVEVEFDTSD